MLYLLICVFLILGTTEQTPKELKCDLPPRFVPNGEVVVNDYQLVPGHRVKQEDFNASVTKVYAYNAQVNCNPGFDTILLGFSIPWPYFFCSHDERPEMPICVSACEKSPAYPGLLSCGMGYDNTESRCKIPNEGIAGFGGTSGPSGPQCGRLASGTLVVNGERAKHGDVPWHVGIYTKATRPYMQICGGTLVKANVVISAAHCFWNDIEKKLPAENFAVAAGKIYRPWNNANDTDSATKSDVSEIRIPPRYRGGSTNFQDDLAVLLLTTPLEVTGSSVVLACLDFNNTLDEKQLQHGMIGTVAGWGLTGADGPASQILNIAKLPIVDIEQCINEAEPSFLTSITSDKICAGYTNGTAVCRGDSGGGLTIPEYDGEDQYFLRGVVSTAPKSDHLCNIYAVATFTQIAKHEFFIKAALSAAPVVENIEIPVSGIIVDFGSVTTKRSSNKPTDKAPLNPLNTDLNPAANPDMISDVFGDRYNNKNESSNINTNATNNDTNLNLNSDGNQPTNKPTRQTTEEPPISPQNTEGTNLNTAVAEVNINATDEITDDANVSVSANRPIRKPNPTVNTDMNPITDVIGDKYNNTNNLDISTAITNAPPIENTLNNKKPTINQEILINTENNNTKNEDSITSTLTPETSLVMEPTVSVLKPIVSDLLPVSLDRNPDTLTIGTSEMKPVLSSDTPTSSVSEQKPVLPPIPSESGSFDQVPVLSLGDDNQKPASSPETSKPIPVSSVPSELDIIHQKPDPAQESVSDKPFVPPNQSGPDYYDWQYWHNNYYNWQNNPQNWHNHHHDCHGNEQNGGGHQYWPNYHHDWQNYHQNGEYHQHWQNYHRDWQNYQNRPYDHQNSQNWPNYEQNEDNNDQQNWHNFLVKSWYSNSNNGNNPDLSQENKPGVY